MEQNNQLLGQPLYGVVLAGGKSARFGTDKAVVAYHGKAMILYALELLASLTNRVYISSSASEHAKLGFRVITDNSCNTGPIAGLQAALTVSGEHPCLVLPTDLPLLTTTIVERIAQGYQANYDAAIARCNHQPQPLVGIYTSRCLPAIENQIALHDYKLLNLLDLLKVLYIDFFIDENASNPFTNINTASQLETINARR